ncbi:MAG: insulinase family protein, partial [Kamptonema sp. SIO4C4]|nr:insulinase family protein [Kamptonema sp. SIO4C4]
MRQIKQFSWHTLLTSLCIALLLWSFAPASAVAQRTPQNNAQSIQPYLDRVIEKVSEFRLENGMKF